MPEMAAYPTYFSSYFPKLLFTRRVLQLPHIGGTSNVKKQFELAIRAGNKKVEENLQEEGTHNPWKSRQNIADLHVWRKPIFTRQEKSISLYRDAWQHFWTSQTAQILALLSEEKLLSRGVENGKEFQIWLLDEKNNMSNKPVFEFSNSDFLIATKEFNNTAMLAPASFDTWFSYLSSNLMDDQLSKSRKEHINYLMSIRPNRSFLNKNVVESSLASSHFSVRQWQKARLESDESLKIFSKLAELDSDKYSSDYSHVLHNVGLLHHAFEPLAKVR